MSKKAEYQKSFREKHGHKFKRVDMLLTVEDAELLASSAKAAGLTKVAYVSHLLHGTNKELIIECDSLRQNLKQVIELNKALQAEVKRLQGDNSLLHVSKGTEKTELLTPKAIYQYEFNGGIAELYVTDSTHYRRERLAGKKRFTAWGNAFSIEIKSAGGELYACNATGEHLLELTGKHK